MCRPLFTACFAILLLCLTLSARAEKYHQTDLAISRDGAVIGEPSFGLTPGVEADITSLDERTPDKSFRLLVTARPSAARESGASDEHVSLDIKFFERVDGEWVLAGEPSMDFAPGRPMRVMFSPKPAQRPASRFEISGTVEEKEGGRKPALGDA